MSRAVLHGRAPFPRAPGGWASLLWAVCLLGACSETPAPAPPRNLLLISIDTLRPDHLGCYGAPRDPSPRLDLLAASGTRFEDVMSSCPWTLPSHASLLTGRYPGSHGAIDNTTALRADVPTLAERLAEQGFDTRAVVNSYYLGDRYGLDRGFRSFDSVSEWDEGIQGRRLANRGGYVTQKALDHLDAVGPAPFFLFVHYYDVHSDYDPAPEFRRQFVREYRGRFTGATEQLVQYREHGGHHDAADAQHLRDLYSAEVRQIDESIGRLLDGLEARGLTGSTLVCVVSDHGEEFFEHGSLLHGRTYYQEVIAIPWILAGPGVPVGTVSQTASLVDVAPTLLSLLGIAPPALDGADLAGLIREGTPPPARFLFAEAHELEPTEKLCVRVEDRKLVLDRATGTVELYDLAEDPGETQDRSAHDPDIVTALKQELDEFQERRQQGEVVGAPSAEELERLQALGYTRD